MVTRWLLALVMVFVTVGTTAAWGQSINQSGFRTHAQDEQVMPLATRVRNSEVEPNDDTRNANILTWRYNYNGFIEGAPLDGRIDSAEHPNTPTRRDEDVFRVDLREHDIRDGQLGISVEISGGRAPLNDEW